MKSNTIKRILELEDMYLPKPVEEPFLPAFLYLTDGEDDIPSMAAWNGEVGSLTKREQITCFIIFRLTNEGIVSKWYDLQYNQTHQSLMPTAIGADESHKDWVLYDHILQTFRNNRNN